MTMSTFGKRRRTSAQRGQAMVLMAVAMIALLAFVVLAIDGGRFYSQRRTSQNASDMAALAALYMYVKSSNPATVSEQTIITEINRVAEINEIQDTDASPARSE